jgi:hypothetical protein
MKALIITNIESRLNVSESFAGALEKTLTSTSVECQISDYDSDYETLIEQSGYDVIIADVSVAHKGDTAIDGLISRSGDTPIITYGFAQYTGDVERALKSGHAIAFHDASKGTPPIVLEALKIMHHKHSTKAYTPIDHDL